MRFENFRSAVEQGRQRKLHYGVQLSVSTPDAEYDVAFGEREPGIPLTAEEPTFWLSAAKPIAAVGVLQLCERRLISLDAPLGDCLPAWQRDDDPQRQGVTLRQLLTHTSPVQEVRTDWPHQEWDAIIQQICAAPLKPEWPSGLRAAYLPSASWFLLGEIIQQHSGQSFANYIQQHVLNPLGLKQTHCRASPENSGSDYLEPQLFDRVRGELQVSQYTERLTATTPAPGASFRGPARELRLFYDALREDVTQGTGRLLQPELAQEMTSRQRVGLFDETLQHAVDYGLGVIVDSKEYGSETVPYGFGTASSRETFGHGGSQCAIGFADPTRQRSVTIIANGRPGEGQHQRRFRELLAALEQDLA